MKIDKQNWMKDSKEDSEEIDRVFKKEQKWLDSIIDGYEDRD